MESKKQTAVEWLANELTLPEYGDNPEWVKEVISKAKEMEKQQIIEARLKPLKMFMELRNRHGYFGGHDNGAVIEREIKESEHYYNETFKQ
jgi:hypothetical protein